MNEQQLFSFDKLTHEELQQAIFALVEYFGLQLCRMPIEKSTNGQTRIELRDAP